MSNILCELSAWQMIHIKCQTLFPIKKKKKNQINIKMSSAAVVTGALRVKQTVFNTMLEKLIIQKT